MSVPEYIDKFEDLFAKCDIQKDSFSTVARFRSGLRLDIRSQMYSHSVIFIEDAYYLALDLEKQLSLYKKFTSESSRQVLKVIKCDGCEGYRHYDY